MHLDYGSTGVLKFDLLSSLPVLPAALKNLLSALRTSAAASQVNSPLGSDTSSEHLDKVTGPQECRTAYAIQWKVLLSHNTNVTCFGISVSKKVPEN